MMLREEKYTILWNVSKLSSLKFTHTFFGIDYILDSENKCCYIKNRSNFIATGITNDWKKHFLNILYTNHIFQYNVWQVEFTS